MAKLTSENAYILGIIIALVAMMAFPHWTSDDAYILYRYSDNLAKSGEFTYNVGEDPIEGYTGVAWPFLLALFIKIGFSPVIMAKILGIAAYFLSGLLLYSILKKLGITGTVRSAALLLYFTASIYFSIAWAGLETMLFMLAIMTCIWLLLYQVSDHEPQRRYWFALSLLFVGLVRPEGVLVAAFCSIAVLAHYWVNRYSELRPFLIRLVALFVLPGAIYFLWRWNYYGQLMPNPFYVKSPSGIINKGSVFYIGLYFITFLLLPALASLLLFLNNPRATLRSISQNYFSGLQRGLGFALGTMAAIFTLVHLQYAHYLLLINFESRLFAPFMPLFLVLLAVVCHCALPTARSRRILLVFASLLLLVQIAVDFTTYRDYADKRGNFRLTIDQQNKPLGLFLKENIAPDEWLIVIRDAGALPFYSGLRTVDFGRLNNEYLLQEDLTMKEIVDYFFSFNAAAVVLTSWRWDKIHQPWIYGPESDHIMADERFNQYVLAQKSRTNAPPETQAANHFLFVYLREDVYSVLYPQGNPYADQAVESDQMGKARR